MEDPTMENRAVLLTKYITLAGFMAVLSSCAVITRSFEGSTETFQNTSDASTDFTSSIGDSRQVALMASRSGPVDL